MRRLELMQLFVVKWHEIAQTFAMKSCENCKCGSCEHMPLLLLLFSLKNEHFCVQGFGSG